MTDLLKNALVPLQEHSLPNKLLPNDAASVDLATITKYTAARDKYLKHRVEETMMESLATFDGTTFDMPTSEAPDGFEAELIAGVKDKANDISKRLVTLLQKHEEFGHKRSELQSIVDQMGEIDADAIGDDEVDVTEEELKEQEMKLHSLRQKKAMLQSKLKGIQDETAAAEKSIVASKEELVKLGELG